MQYRSNSPFIFAFCSLVRRTSSFFQCTQLTFVKPRLFSSQTNAIRKISTKLEVMTCLSASSIDEFRHETIEKVQNVSVRETIHMLLSPLRLLLLLTSRYPLRLTSTSASNISIQHQHPTSASNVVIQQRYREMIQLQNAIFSHFQAQTRLSNTISMHFLGFVSMPARELQRHCRIFRENQRNDTHNTRVRPSLPSSNAFPP